MEQSGAIYKINGKQQDPLTILKDNGVNYVRLRFWVDPGKQNLPKAWQNQSFEQLNSTVYSYTADVLNQIWFKLVTNLTAVCYGLTEKTGAVMEKNLPA